MNHRFITTRGAMLAALLVALLLPVLREVAALGGFDVGIIAPAYVESGQGRVQEGLSPAMRERLDPAGVLA